MVYHQEKDNIIYYINKGINIKELNEYLEFFNTIEPNTTIKQMTPNVESALICPYNYKNERKVYHIVSELNEAKYISINHSQYKKIIYDNNIK